MLPAYRGSHHLVFQNRHTVIPGGTPESAVVQGWQFFTVPYSPRHSSHPSR